MKLLRAMSRICRIMSRYLDHPKLLRLRLLGGVPDTYLTFSVEWIQRIRIATILDIGANDGKFAFSISQVFPQATLYSFEPQPEPFTQLMKRMQSVSNFEGFNIGLGQETGKLPFYKNNYSPSSSFLRMSEKHIAAFPNRADWSC